MWRALMGGPLWVDAISQRAINTGMFAAMRVGTTKAVVRYAIHAAAIVALAGMWVSYVQAIGLCWPTVGAATTIPLWIFIQHHQRRTDEREETSGLPIERRSGGERIWFWGALILNGASMTDGLPPSGEFAGHGSAWWLFMGCSFTFSFLALLAAYSAATPPRPPSREPRRVLVPTESKS